MTMRKYILPSLRVLSLLLVAAAVLLWIDYRVARASVLEHLLGFGEAMAPYMDNPRTTEAAREIRVNGATFFLAAGHTEHSPAEVRKFYRDRYIGKDGGLGDLSADLVKKHALPKGMPEARVVDFGNDNGGGVAALDWGEGKSDIGAIVKRLGKIVKTGDLGDFARLRYAYTERRSTDDGGGTRFLTIWTDERFNLNQLIAPARGADAPGFDIDRIPRYPGTTRSVSMEEVGLPQRLVVYEGGGSPSTAQMFYRARMKSYGWVEEKNFAEVLAQKGQTGLHFASEGHECFLYLSDRAQGSGLTVAVLLQH